MRSEKDPELLYKSLLSPLYNLLPSESWISIEDLKSGLDNTMDIPVLNIMDLVDFLWYLGLTERIRLEGRILFRRSYMTEKEINLIYNQLKAIKVHRYEHDYSGYDQGTVEYKYITSKDILKLTTLDQRMLRNIDLDDLEIYDIFITLERSGRLYFMLLLLLTLSENLYVYEKLREKLPMIDQSDPRIHDIKYILRCIQMNAVKIKIPDTDQRYRKDTLRRTYEGRVLRIKSVIDREIGRLEKKYKKIYLGDFATSDAISCYEIAKLYEGRNVIFTASDIVLYMYKKIFASGLTGYFESSGRPIQILKDNRVLTCGDIEKTGNRETAGYIKEASISLESKDSSGFIKISLVDPEAEKYALNNTGRFIFMEHDINEKPVNKFHIITVSNLLNRFQGVINEAGIRKALKVLGASVYEKGSLITSVMFKYNTYYDIYRREGNCLILDAEASNLTEEVSYDGWKRIELD